jgi:SEC-C motif-containing protein
MAKKHPSSKKALDAALLTMCPCESGKPYQSCCEPYHLGAIPAPTAEALMRSRYTAYTLGLEAYLLQTWHPDTRPHTLNLAEDQAIKWQGLQVKQVTTSETTATVNFVARYKIGGKAERLHELSQFTRIENAWYYLRGTNPRTDSDTSY